VSGGASCHEQIVSGMRDHAAEAERRRATDANHHSPANGGGMQNESGNCKDRRGTKSRMRYTGVR
jgi:hypothetical protein